MNDLPARVKNVLEGLPLEDPQISVHVTGTSVFATVVSGSFAGVDEADRQVQVWHALRRSLSADDVVALEFVFTYAPDELVDEAEEAV